MPTKPCLTNNIGNRFTVAQSLLNPGLQYFQFIHKENPIGPLKIKIKTNT